MLPESFFCSHSFQGDVQASWWDAFWSKPDYLWPPALPRIQAHSTTAILEHTPFSAWNLSFSTSWPTPAHYFQESSKLSLVPQTRRRALSGLERTAVNLSCGIQADRHAVVPVWHELLAGEGETGSSPSPQHPAVSDSRHPLSTHWPVNKCGNLLN